ncbi:hypothetical protein OMW55_05645 [Sphingomonas sp. BN140010]|uniref:Lipoprotein n=1 Tax=Sphingomonas arvum TaxID=2992113 RepID=A0ABT3JEQ4_9SPHN|nr:hypothetical protein [Sphingomonas sp. BN140010]MCW3797291.1 hypothetical protein [Sphingomonas sp. BN140010]
MRLLYLTPLLSLAACATPSDRITDALEGYGLAPQQARCVGDRLQSRLSVGQLQELAGLARTYRENDPNPQALTPTDLIRVASGVHDVRVPLEVGKAAANCGLIPGTTIGLLNMISGA